MSFAALLPPVPALLLEQTILGKDCLTLVARLTTTKMPCPDCGRFSRQVHSRTRRTLCDLSVAGRQVRLSLQVRRFFCRTPTSPRRTFREQEPILAAKRARRMEHLQAKTGGGGEHRPEPANGDTGVEAWVLGGTQAITPSPRGWSHRR